MSDEIKVLFEIRNMLIMKETLKEMGIDYNELSEHSVEIQRPYHNMVINSETGEVTLDEENKQEMDIICQKYQINWYKDRAVREGNHVREEVRSTGEIVLHVTR